MIPLKHYRISHHRNPIEIDTNNTRVAVTEMILPLEIKKQKKVEDQIERDQREHGTQLDREQSKLGEVRVTELELEIGLIDSNFDSHLTAQAWHGLVLFVLQTNTIRRSFIAFRLPSCGTGRELESPSHHITRTDGGILNSTNQITEGNGTTWTTGKNRSWWELEDSSNCKETQISTHAHHRTRTDNKNGNKSKPMADLQPTLQPSQLWWRLMGSMSRPYSIRLSSS